MKSVLVTGGGGFLGVYLSRFLLDKGYKVVALDRSPSIAPDIKNKIKFIQGDIRNKKKMLSTLRNVDYVVHAAAALPVIHDRKEISKTNVDGTKNVLEGALKNRVKRVVFISSTEVYGVPKILPEKEDNPLDPIGPYGESKIEAEKLCFSYLRRGLSLNILRPKTFLGPGRLGVFTLWFEAIFNNKPVFILGNGNNLYQLLDVNDLCDAIAKSLETKKTGEIFNVGAEKFSTWRSDLRSLIRHAKSRSKIVSLPIKISQFLLSILDFLNLSPIVAWHYKTLPVNSYVSIEKAKKYLNFKPKKSNREILQESYDWYKDNRERLIGKRTGITHRTMWNFKLIDIIRRL